jgi:hypothetical protein
MAKYIGTAEPLNLAMPRHLYDSYLNQSRRQRLPHQRLVTYAHVFDPMKLHIAIATASLLACQVEAFFFFPLFIPLPLVIIHGRNTQSGCPTCPTCPPCYKTQAELQNEQNACNAMGPVNYQCGCA